MTTETLQALYRAYTGASATEVAALPAAGSARRYYRLAGAQTLIGVCGTSVEENEAFLYMAAHFRRCGLPVPQVYAVSADRLYYLQEDLGDLSLYDALAQGRSTGTFSTEERELLRKAIRLLPQVQFSGAQGFDFSRCYPQPAFNCRSVMWDLNYFKYSFLKIVQPDFQEDRLEDDFERMAELLLRVPADAFMYRDFQSRNIMLHQGQPWLIDFQGGRRGPFYYDVASFLWQAKAMLPDDLREELLAEYLKSSSCYRQIDPEEFYDRLRHFVLFRTLQVLGAYGFRGYFEKKSHFLESIPYAVGNLRELLRRGFPEYPYLCEVLQALTALPQLAAAKPLSPGLTVHVTSFSYRRGIPEDHTGNGGGYVFDCRAVHNPGKYDRYKLLTGLDHSVIAFLEEDGEILHFLQAAQTLVDASVQRYLERGFSHLSVCFGCTGGQHRSVYSAQRLAEHVHRTYGVRVELWHREQNIRQTLEPLSQSCERPKQDEP